jgi:hypothetical protein
MRKWWVVAAAAAAFVFAIIVYGAVLAPNSADRNAPGATTGTGKGSIRD